jgi:hypothetical protein
MGKMRKNLLYNTRFPSHHAPGRRAQHRKFMKHHDDDDDDNRETTTYTRDESHKLAVLLNVLVAILAEFSFMSYYVNGKHLINNVFCVQVGLHVPLLPRMLPLPEYLWEVANGVDFFCENLRCRNVGQRVSRKNDEETYGRDLIEILITKTNICQELSF